MSDFLSEYKSNRKLRLIAMIPFIIAFALFVTGFLLPYYQISYGNETITYSLFSNTKSVSLWYFIGVLLAIFVCFSIVMNFDLNNKNEKFYFIFPALASVISIISIVLIFSFSKPSPYPETEVAISSERRGLGSTLIFISLIVSSLSLIMESMLLYKINNGWTAYRQILKLEAPIRQISGPVDDYYDLDEVKMRSEELGIIEPEESKCPVCGQVIDEHDTYCSSCGTRIEKK